MAAPSPRTLRIAVTAWAAITFAALLSSFMAFRPVRDALALDGKTEDIPWLFTATFVGAIAISPVWSRMLARRPKRLVVPQAFHAFALCALVFAALLYSRWQPVGVGRAFYIWSSVFNLFVVSVFWSLLVDLIGPVWAKRLYGPISAGGTIGTIAGPFFARVVVEAFDVAGVLVLCAILLEIAVVGAWRVRLAGEALSHEEGVGADEPVASTPWEGFHRVVRSRYLLAIVGYVLCTAIAATFVYLEQASIIKEGFSTREARAEFFSELDLWIALATFGVQTVIAGPLLRWIGAGLVLCLLPLAQGAAISALAIAPTVTVLAIVQIVSRSFTHGLTRPARELLFTVVSREDKYHAKNVIDLAGYRFGDVVGGWAKTGVTALGGGAATVMIAAAPLVAVWIGLAIALGIAFRHRASDASRPESPPSGHSA
ncbi:MAG TPA: MFS transporter [Kofleriaceae bacterium]|nr:MFS transporter [Kofleriaceae bacterium]